MFKNYIIKDNILYLELNTNYEFGNFNINNSNIIKEIKKYVTNKPKIQKIIFTCSGIIIGSILLTNFNKEITSENIKYVPDLKNEVIIKLPENEKENNIKFDNNIKENITAKDDLVSNNINNNNNSEKNVNNKSSNIVDENSNDNITQPSDSNITIKRRSGEIQTLKLEKYIIGVVASEIPASFNIEALKAQSVIARTYALKAKQINKTLTDTVNTQSYIDIDQMKKMGI